jgi:hypothetical protein
MPASASAIRAGRAFVELFADDKALVRTLKATEKRLKDFGQGIRNVGLGLAGIGASIAAPLAVAAKTFADAGDSLDEMSQRTGISVESLSQLQFGLDLAGTSLAGFEKALRRQQKTLAEAAGGSKSAQQAFADLGLNWEDLQRLSPEGQFLAVAEAISRIEDPGRRAAAALEVFGRGGAELLPVLSAGADGIGKLKAEADRLGLTMSSHDAKAAAAFSDALDTLAKTVRRLVIEVGSALAPILTEIANRITPVAVAFRDFAAQNPQLVTSLAAVAAGMVAAGGAMAGIGVATSALGSGVGLVATAFTALNGVLSGGLAILGALASPVGLLVAAIGTFVTATVDWSSAWETVASAGETALATIMSGLPAIQAALAPVIETVQTGLVAAWQTVSEAAAAVFGFIGELLESNREAISQWGMLVGEIARNVFGGLMEVVSTTVNWIGQQWQNLFGVTFTEALAAGFTLFANFVRDVLDTLSLLTTNWGLTWDLVKNGAGLALFFVLDTVAKVGQAIEGVVRGAAAAVGDLIAAVLSGDFESIGTRMAESFSTAFTESLSRETPFGGMLDDFKEEHDRIVAQMEAERARLREARSTESGGPATATRTGATPPALPGVPTLPSARSSSVLTQFPELGEVIDGLDEINESTKRVEEAAKQTAEQLPDALVVGTQEAADAILKAQFGGRDTAKVEEQQLTEQKAIRRSLEAIDRNTRNVARIEIANVA